MTRHDAPGCSSFAQRVAALEDEISSPGYVEHATEDVSDLIRAVREQQAALSSLLNDVEPHATCAWAEGESVTEARAMLARWRIEP